MTSIADWMKVNCLKLNNNKMEVLIFGNNHSPWVTSWWPSELGSTPTRQTTAETSAFSLTANSP